MECEMNECVCACVLARVHLMQTAYFMSRILLHEHGYLHTYIYTYTLHGSISVS